MPRICTVLTILATGMVLFADSVISECHAKFKQFDGHTACMEKSIKATALDVPKDEIVDLHNKLRATVSPAPSNMLKMRWDDELAMIAQKWAEACGSGHDQLRFVPGRFSVGQNLAAGNKNFSSAISNWVVKEVGDYIYGTKIWEQMDKVTGHYTQVVWAQSYLIGCGAAMCEGETYPARYVCNYGPAGNVANFDRPYDTGEACSGGCLHCDGGLCDCGTTQCNGGTLDPSTCQCSCLTNGGMSDPHFWDDKDCHMTCEAEEAKDLFMCGSSSWTVDNCNTGFVHTMCPFMCHVCPYSDPCYNSGNCSAEGIYGNGDTYRQDGNSGNAIGLDEDKDSSSVTITVSISLIALSNLLMTRMFIQAI